jgi:hypothetical protein
MAKLFKSVVFRSAAGELSVTLFIKDCGVTLIVRLFTCGFIPELTPRVLTFEMATVLFVREFVAKLYTNHWQDVALLLPVVNCGEVEVLIYTPFSTVLFQLQLMEVRVLFPVAHPPQVPM